MLTPGQKLYKRIPFSCHTCPLPLLWHEFDNFNYFLQYKVSCCPQVEDLGKILHDLGRSWQGQGLGKPLILARSCQDITNILPRLFNLAKILPRLSEILAKIFQSEVSCCLHMYFLWRHHLPPDKLENDQDSDSDWFTYCIDIRL